LAADSTRVGVDVDWSSTNFPWDGLIRQLLDSVFNIDSFRSNQREVVNATMAKRDVFVLMPTGGGKSLCYQLPAISCEGVTIVISPLLALIQDQVMLLKGYNIPCAFLGTNQTEASASEVFKGT
jgi:bloom syndrome protein